MKINISTKKPDRPKPATPSVSLTHEAYDSLMELSVKYNISMRKLASEVIMKALENIEIEEAIYG